MLSEAFMRSRWQVEFLSLFAYLLFFWLFAGLLRHLTRVLESYLRLQTVGMVFFPVTIGFLVIEFFHAYAQKIQYST